MNNAMNLSHAKKLRYLRKVHDKKQVDVAKALSLSQQAYSKLENGETSFAEETIEKIASYFKITAADFEKPMEAININNNHNNSGNVNTIDLKLIETLQKTYEQNTELQKLLLLEKDKRIKQLEELLNKKS